jgi:hypothetical protein
MRKNRNTTSPEIKRFGFFDILVIFLCLLGAAGTLSFFWKEFNRTQVKLNEEPVGMVTYRNRTAHRRFEERVIWDRLREASPVYNGDTVRLADLSGAVITFIDGSTSIDLSENTLVQIFYSGGGTRIDLSGGGLVVNSGGTGKVLVSSGENAVSLSGGSAGINSDDLGFGLSVTEGEASVNGTIVESGAVRSFTKDGTVDTAPLIAVTSLESAVRILNYGDSAPVNFSWNSANFSPDTMVVVEVALDRAFKNIVERRQVQGENSVIISLENGSYWWHAYPSENGAIRTVKDRFLTSGRIDVAPSVPAFPLEPADGREFSFSGESRVILSWTAMEEVSRYLLELADNAAMINPVVSRQIEGSSFLVKGLEEGIWYWRVTPVFSARIKGDSAPSAVREFSVARSEIPPVPEPAGPAENAEIDISGEKITLSWAWNSAAASWKFEAADNPEMKNPLAAEIVYSNFYSLVPGRLKLVPGSNYYWRVSALSEDGVSSAPSPVRSFIAVTEPGTARLTRNAARSGQSPAESGQPSAEALFKDGDFLPAGMENPPENENPETGAVTAAETTALAEVRPDPLSAVIEASVPASPEQAAGAETAKPPLPVEDLGEGIVTVAGSTITLRHSFTTQNNTDLAVTGGKTFIVPRGMTLDLASGGIILEDNTVFNVEGIVNVTSSFTYIPTLRIASAISMPARITGNGIIHLVQRGELLNISHANKLILENITLDGLTTATKDPRGNDYPAGIGGDHTDNNTVLVTVGGELEMRGTATITGNTYYKPSGGFGGSGMYVSGAGRVTMNGRSQITGNTLSSDYGADGGGVYVGGVLVMNDQSSITGNLLRTGKDWAGGGGVRVSGGSLIMNDEARIANNTASCGGGWASGGGVHVAPSISATLTMNGGIIEGNRVSAVNRGGAQLEVDNATARYGDGKNIIRRSSANGIDSVNNTIKGRR